MQCLTHLGFTFNLSLCFVGVGLGGRQVVLSLKNGRYEKSWKKWRNWISESAGSQCQCPQSVL